MGKLIYWFLHTWLLVMRQIGWFRWSVAGLEQLPARTSGGMIIAMNHVNWMDIPVIGTLLPLRYRLSWLGKSELFARPFGNWFFSTMQVIPVKRGKRDLAAIESVVDALRGGAVLLIFPEGTRSRSGVLREGRGGAVRMALQANVPIVPVAVIGTEHGLGGSLRRKPVHLQIGQAYMPEAAADDGSNVVHMKQLTDELMSRIALLLPVERRGLYAQLAAAQAQPETTA